MANVKIIGDAIVITSEVKFEDYQLVQKMKPKALSLYEENSDGKLVPVFRVNVCDGEVRPTDVNENGITFRKGSRDGGYAQITAKAPAGDGDIKELVAEVFGGPLAKLIELEEQLPFVLDAIHDAHEAVLENIEVL